MWELINNEELKKGFVNGCFWCNCLQIIILKNCYFANLGVGLYVLFFLNIYVKFTN